MSRAVMQEFLRGKPNGEPKEFEGDDFVAVTELVFLDVLDTMDALAGLKFMIKWLKGEPYAEQLGSFSVREYESGVIGVWYEWVYTD